MSYKAPFTLTGSISNNAFSFEKRNDPKLFVTSVQMGNLADLAVGELVVFEDVDEHGNLKSCVGLKNFIRTDFNGVPMIVVDNHNHVFYFWHEAKKQGIIADHSTLIHVDQHADTREPQSYLSASESNDLEKVFRYANTVLNVGNFIVPAQKTGLIGNIIQIRGEADLARVDSLSDASIVLDLDLDFFAPELGYINFDRAKQTILAIASKAKLITVATSPFFIDQPSAIGVLKKLFS